MDSLVDRLRNRINDAPMATEHLLDEAAARITALEAREAELVGALNAAWAQATQMRNAAKLVGPYPNDHAKNRIWARALYHEGKTLHSILKPARALLERQTDG